MTNQDIIALRLQQQLVKNSTLVSPHEVVRHMVAVQAQDYRSSLWAIGLRMNKDVGCDEELIEQAFIDKKIVRTWPMRGTLHWVAAEDARWMLQLLAPKVIKGSQGRYRQLELDERVFDKSREILERNLAGGKQLTRAEIYQLLEQEGIRTHDQRSIHIIGHWAMKGLLCQVPKKDKQDTFALLEEWLPSVPELKGEEAWATLADRYIKSRGPATEYDFATWSGLKISDARRGLEMVFPKLEKVTVEGNCFRLSEPAVTPVDPSGAEQAWLLPAFDEMLCGYKDRSALLDSTEIKSTILKNGIFKPVVLLDNRAVGTWQRTIKANQVLITFSFFGPLSNGKRQLVIDKAMRLEGFFNKQIVVVP
jgi:hypothetical protein